MHNLRKFYAFAKRWFCKDIWDRNDPFGIPAFILGLLAVVVVLTIAFFSLPTISMGFFLVVAIVGMLILGVVTFIVATPLIYVLWWIVGGFSVLAAEFFTGGLTDNLSESPEENPEEQTKGT